MSFTRTYVFDEDELFVMFTMPDSDWADTWNWRALTTNPGNMAECFTYSEGTLEADVGVNNFAMENTDHIDNSRPRWIHNDKALFQDPILYRQQAFEPETGGDFGTGWEVGDMVAGWIIDSTIIDLLNSSQESRWDVNSVFAYDGGTNKMKLVLTHVGSGFGEMPDRGT